MQDPHATLPFGSLLRSLRLAAGLTQEALAECSGVAARTVQDLERGLARPRRETVRRLVAVLNPAPEARAWFEAATSAPRAGTRPVDRRSDHRGMARGARGVDGRRVAALRGQTPIPSPLTSFVGRERELAELLGLIQTSRLLTLTGPGGCGKTRLALELASRVAEQFPDGYYFVSLAPLADPGLVASTIAEAVGIREAPDLPVTESLRRGIGDRRMLLVLDNFEHLLAAAPLLVDLLAACQQLTAVVTSREVLRLSGEQVYPVPSLTLPDPGAVPPGEPLVAALAGSEAVRLFVERARSAHPNFRLDAANAAAVAELCVRLDGLPLALELAAARVKMLPPAAMVTRFDRRLPLLTGGARDLPARQRTLRDTIAWSHDLLDGEEQRLFRRMAVFAGGATLDAIEAVCGPESPSPYSAGRGPGPDMLDGVASLLDKNLLRQVEGPDQEPRFVMLETVREFAAEQLEASDGAESVRRRHGEYYLIFAELARSRLRRPEAVRWLRRLDAEHDNLRAALDWGEARSDPPADAGGDGLSGIEIATRIAQALAWYWMLRSQLRQGRARTIRLLERAPRGTPARARALLVAGAMATYLTDAAEALRLGEESLAAWRALGDRHHVAVALARVAHAEGLLGRIDRARALLEESEALSGDARMEADLENPIVLMLAMATNTAGDLDGARLLFEQSLDLGRTDGDLHTTLASLRHLGTLARRRGEVEVARRLIAESLRLARDLGDYLCTGNALGALALVAVEAGEAERAAHLLAALNRLHEVAGMPFIALSGAEASIAAARDRLGGETFTRSWARGRAMSLEQAVAYALGEPDPARSELIGSARTDAT